MYTLTALPSKSHTFPWSMWIVTALGRAFVMLAVSSAFAKLVGVAPNSNDLLLLPCPDVTTSR